MRSPFSFFRACLLLCVMAWQVLVCALVPGVLQIRSSIDHVVLHGEQIDHHHHEDASLHMVADADDVADAHHHAHDGSASSALCDVVGRWVFDTSAHTLNAHRLSPWSSATLDGLLRPPSVAS